MPELLRKSPGTCQRSVRGASPNEPGSGDHEMAVIAIRTTLGIFIFSHCFLSCGFPRKLQAKQ